MRSGHPSGGWLAGRRPAPDPTGEPSRGFAAGRRALTLVLFAWGLYGLLHAGTFTLLDSVDLAVHETGHLVFAPFGEFLEAAGGTILQLLVPVSFAWYFWRRGDRHAVSVALWWEAQNLGNVATYVADARAQELPLVGGGEHDWAFLLAELDVLHRDTRIAHLVQMAAIVLMVGASIWGYVQAGRRTTPDA